MPVSGAGALAIAGLELFERAEARRLSTSDNTTTPQHNTTQHNTTRHAVMSARTGARGGRQSTTGGKRQSVAAVVVDENEAASANGTTSAAALAARESEGLETNIKRNAAIQEFDLEVRRYADILAGFFVLFCLLAVDFQIGAHYIIFIIHLSQDFLCLPSNFFFPLYIYKNIYSC